MNYMNEKKIVKDIEAGESKIIICRSQTKWFILEIFHEKSQKIFVRERLSNRGGYQSVVSTILLKDSIQERQINLLLHKLRFFVE